MTRALRAGVVVLTVVFGGLAVAWAGDPYAVIGVAVDETAADAAAARDAAMAVGQRGAWATLVRRLVAPDEADRLLALDDARVGAMVQSFEVIDEKVGPDRYIAHMTFRFDGAAVRQAFRDFGATRTVAESPPVLVLPVLDRGGEPLLFELDNGWRDAWQKAAADAGLVPVVVPIGDLRDIAAIDAASAVAGDEAALAAIAARYGTGSVAVAVAHLPADGAVPSALAVDLTVRRGGGTDVGSANYPASAGPETTFEDLFAAAARGSIERLEDAWRAGNLIDTGTETAVAIEVPVTTLADWVDVQRRLAGVGSIRAIGIGAMGAKAISLTVTYVGDEARLGSALASAGLDLRREADIWVLRKASSGAAADTVIVE